MLRNIISVLLIAGMTSLLLPCPSVAADEHVVNSGELQKAILDQARARQGNLSKLHDFFSSGPAVKALKKARLDPVKIEHALPQLDDEDLARLAARTGQIRHDFAAGALTNEQLTYIIIALATAVIVLIIVER